MSEPETITGVALLRNDGAMWSLPAPARHNHLYALAAFVGQYVFGAYIGEEEQGFTTSQGRFVDRKQALTIAQGAGQPIRKHGNITELYSEDLW